MPSEHISYDYDFCSQKSEFANRCGDSSENMMEHECEEENGAVLSECSDIVFLHWVYSIFN